ncbi:centromere protein T isoform X2 [Gambusia affinis]|uniref:centromere protein T isoform X2 n=1 Tax=Gambusia affinis TaxID=33528 RepID=UPI001CDC84F3|nr:centromere protein T isoform X2 [Gambusia affinis]
MDSTEDLSPRILLKQILITEPPRTPVGSSEPQAAGSSEPRRSSRRSRRDAEPQTPQNILRRSLRNKIQENITRKSLPLKRRTASAVLRQQRPSSSMMFDDGETPRHLLRNILQTEPVKSPVVHDKVAPAELQPPSEDNTVTRSRSSFELSGLDLPDVTMGNIVSAAKGLSRKRPRQSLNVTAFEKRLKDAEEPENSIGEHSSLSLSSSSSLSLKTPFVDVHTEKRGLQRRVSNRRKITEEEFSAALSKQQTGDVSREALQGREVGGEDTNLAGITLGLSKLSEPDVTVDIVNCQTALYDQHDAMTSNFSITATQDKPTVMATQLQRDMQEEEERQKSAEEEEVMTNMEEEEEVMTNMEEDEEVMTNMEEDEAKEIADKTQDVSSKPEEKDDAVGFQTFDLDDGTEAAADSQSEDVEGGSEEEEAAVGSQAEDEGVEQSPTEEETAADSQSEDVEGSEEEEAAGEEEEGVEQSPTEEDAAVASPSEEEDAVSSQVEDEGVEDGPPEDAAAATPSEEEEAAGEEGEGVEQSPTEEDAAVASPSEEEATAGSQPEDEGGSVVGLNQLQRDNEEKWDGADHQTDEDYKDEERNREEERHISRRAFRSEGGLVLPVVKATEGISVIKSKSYSALGLNTSLERIQNQTGKPDWAKPSLQHLDEDSWDVNDPADRKNASFHLLRVSHDAEVSGQQEDVEAAAEEESDEEEDDNEDFPGKTPAFVREKIKFFTSSLPASPSVSKNLPASASEALPAAKPKQARRRRTGLSRRETVLPKTYLTSVFKHFAKTKVSADVFPVLNEIMDKFFDRVAEDLETYAAHAKRKTIEVEDVELLLRRQGFVNDKVPVEVLIEKYLRMDQRKILIPIATSGNVVIPKIRK